MKSFMQMWEIIEENQLAQNVENFPIANLRRRNGEIGTQGVSSSQIADILINVAGLNVSKDMNMRELVDALKANPQAQQRLRNFMHKAPIEVLELPDGSFHLKDGHHRAFLINLLGDETIPAVVR
jgi:hypothetical protein